MTQPPETEARGRKRIREAEDERESKTQKPLGDDIVPTTCSEASEPDGEADDNAPSFRKRNALIHKGPTGQPNSPSPGLEIIGDFGGVQHSSPPSLVTSVSARQRPQQRGRVEPSQQTEPYESASQNAISIPHGEDSYQSRPIMTKSRAELENECKSTTQMVELVSMVKELVSMVKELASEMNERFDALYYGMVDHFDALHDGMVDQDQDDN
ncbi:hypothetical protein MY8738_006390 [Beauveria namnaoensis]